MRGSGTTSHPITPNSNEYFYEKKYVSINSEDRNQINYPNSNTFEIELPQDICNVASVRLYSWSFPANYDVFTPINNNVTLSFVMPIDTLYNPPNPEENIQSQLYYAIYTALSEYADTNHEYIIRIQSGFYNPEQMANELTNKFNETVSNIITAYLVLQGDADTTILNYFQSIGQYRRFQIVYNSVSQKLWFGNSADGFMLSNDSKLFVKNVLENNLCIKASALPETSNWGLPAFLGFTRCPAQSFGTTDYNLARFYYQSNFTSTDNGYWLLPDIPGIPVYVCEAPFKINFMGPAYIYMQIDPFNCIDETSPYNFSEFTVKTNQTNSRIESFFAKIAIPTTPISQWFDDNMTPYKYFNPPAERVRKLKIHLRYHNGQHVDFGLFPYSFMLEFNILRPQFNNSYAVRDAFNLGQLQNK